MYTFYGSIRNSSNVYVKIFQVKSLNKYSKKNIFTITFGVALMNCPESM